MPKKAAFSVRLEDDFRRAFMEEAKAANRPAAQIVREMMREFVDRQRAARQYEAFLGRKVAQARASVLLGRGRSNDEVEAVCLARRRLMLRNSGGSQA